MPPLRKSKAACVLAALLVLSACGSQPGSGGGSDAAGEVTLTTPTWAGGQANTAVAAYILEEELGYEVTVTMLDEKEAWQAIGTGEADAILEDWGHPELEEKYVDVEETVVSAGDLGVTGKIGWYVPAYLAAEHPGITDWRNLNRYADLLATPETGGKGRLLEGSPEFLTRDEQLIENLGLDLETVYAGSEAAQLAEIRELARKRKPFLTYWWRPHWVESEIDLAEVSLPPALPGLRGRRRNLRVRLPGGRAAEVPQRGLRPERRQSRAVPGELPLDGGRPERRRPEDRRRRPLPADRGEALGREQRGHLGALALEPLSTPDGRGRPAELEALREVALGRAGGRRPLGAHRCGRGARCGAVTST